MSKDSNNLTKGDYIELVINFLGDSAGSIPLAGGFITAVKNAGVNVYLKKQNKKLLTFLSDLEKKVINIEDIFKNKIEDERFLHYFYKFLYQIRDITNIDEYNSRLNYIIKYLKDEYHDSEKIFIFDVLNNLTPISFTLLKKFNANNNSDWINLKNYYCINDEKKIGISFGDIEPIEHKTILDLIKYGLLVERHTNFYGKNSSSFLEDIKINELGLKIINLLE